MILSTWRNCECATTSYRLHIDTIRDTTNETKRVPNSDTWNLILAGLPRAAWLKFRHRNCARAARSRRGSLDHEPTRRGYYSKARNPAASEMERGGDEYLTRRALEIRLHLKYLIQLKNRGTAHAPLYRDHGEQKETKKKNRARRRRVVDFTEFSTYAVRDVLYRASPRTMT